MPKTQLKKLAVNLPRPERLNFCRNRITMKLKVFNRKLKDFVKKILWLIPRVIFRVENKIYNRSRCPQDVLSKLDQVLTQATPCKIVVKPWNGRHNVYGVFMLPVENQSGKMLVVHIPGVRTFCGATERVGTSFEGIQAKPGYYLVKAYLRTRISTWLIVRGLGKQLKDIRNWRLIDY
jgi:hypothetical protein